MLVEGVQRADCGYYNLENVVPVESSGSRIRTKDESVAVEHEFTHGCVWRWWRLQIDGHDALTVQGPCEALYG